MKQFSLFVLFLLLFSACRQEADSTNDQSLNSHSEIQKSDERGINHKTSSIEGADYKQESSPRYLRGRYYLKLDKGSILVQIHPVTDTSCRFVFDTGPGTPYFAKLAGDLLVDQNGRATYSGPRCKTLDFHFTEKGISIKEFECRFHSPRISFDGFYTSKIPLSDNPKALLLQLELEEVKFDFYASFTEPFWTLYFIEDKVLFNHMEEDGPDIYTLKEKFNPKKDKQLLKFFREDKEWEVLIEKGKGSDGMSDITYPYRVVLNDNFHGGGGVKFIKESL